jgi:hypothetical protein
MCWECGGYHILVTCETCWGAYSRAAVRDQRYRLHKHRYLLCRLGTPLTPGWDEVIKAKRHTQSLTPTVGFEPGTSWPLVRDPSHYTPLALWLDPRLNECTGSALTRVQQHYQSFLSTPSITKQTLSRRKRKGVKKATGGRCEKMRLTTLYRSSRGRTSLNIRPIDSISA